MKLEVLNDKEFMDFVNNQDTKNFFQTVMMKEKYENDNREVYLLGLKKDKKVVAATLVAVKESFLGYKVFEAYKGFIIDYKNQQLLEEFTTCIKLFLKDKKAMKLIIDPYIPNISRDCDGNIVEGKIDNRDVIETLEKLGYKKTSSEQVKWVYCLDLENKSEEEILKEMQANTRNCINKTISKYGLEYKTLNYDELPLFKKITEETCDRKHFQDRSLKYYQDMYNYFKEEVTFKMVSLNCDTFIKITNQEINSIKEKVSKLSTSKANDKKRANYELDIKTLEKKIKEVKELKQKKDNIIPLSVGMFMLYGDEIVYLFSGSYKEYMSFFGQYRIQWEIIKYGLEKGYKRYNFYGIKEFRDKNNPDYGVYKFKKGFGGYVEELLGPFELEITSFNKIYTILKKIKKLFRR